MADYDLIIKNGEVFDGTGGPSKALDVAIKDGVISKGKGTFQKGFTHAEIEDFVKSILGTDFSVGRTAGSNALLITRLR